MIILWILCNSMPFIQVMESINEISSIPSKNLADLRKYGNHEPSQLLHLLFIVKAKMHLMRLRLQMECKFNVFLEKIFDELDFGRLKYEPYRQNLHFCSHYNTLKKLKTILTNSEVKYIQQFSFI